MVLASYARRLLQPPAAGDATAAEADRAMSADRPKGLLAEFRRGPVIAPVEIPAAIQVVRLIVLVMVVVTVPLSTPHIGQGPHGIATAVTLAVSVASWVVWQFCTRGRPRLWLAMLALLGAAGGILAGVSSLSTAIAVSFMVVVSAGARLSADVSLAIVAETVAAFLVAALVSGAPGEAIAGWTAGLFGMWAFGLTRRAYLQRAVEAEQALEQARRAHAAETQAAAFAERARIAREIHDVLAHSLAAVSVNLQAAEGLLDAVPGKSAELARAVECVLRAGALTREGMAETRRAILALRDDAPDGTAAGQTSQPPGYASLAGPAPASPAAERLAVRLRTLVDEHRAVGDTAVELAVAGTPHPVGAEAALTVYRTAQEALTNARKHAPGQPVSLTVAYTQDDVALQVSNPLPVSGTERPLAHSGAGYGLTGLAERAALAGGTLAAGPDGGEWRVLLRIPAAP